MTIEKLCVGFWGLGYWNRLDDKAKDECKLAMAENIGPLLQPIIEQAFRDGAAHGDQVFARAYTTRTIEELVATC